MKWKGGEVMPDKVGKTEPEVTMLKVTIPSVKDTMDLRKKAERGDFKPMARLTTGKFGQVEVHTRDSGIYLSQGGTVLEVLSSGKDANGHLVLSVDMIDTIPGK